MHARVVMLAGLTACAEPSAREWTATPLEWTSARRELAAMRGSLPQKPYVETVTLVIDDPRTHHEIRARGAIAVSPSRAARMIVVGPGGITALDLWVTPERFRFVVPALHLERRGGRSAKETEGLPVGMLRWWFLDPLAGQLLAAHGSSWLLRDGTAIVRIDRTPAGLSATRRDQGLAEGIEWSALVPAAGMHGRYLDLAHKITIDVTVEALSASEPEPEAFVDPDQEEP